MSKNNPLLAYGCILHAKWVKHSQPNTIIGKWAEDDSTYVIVVPEQLRDIIIGMQNTLSNLYVTTTDLQNSVSQMLGSIERIFDIKSNDAQ